MDIDITQTIVAFDKVSDDMEYLTRQVHDYVLLSGFLDTHRKAVGKAVDSIAHCNEELTIQTFIGKLKFKLPQLRMGIPLHEFDKATSASYCCYLDSPDGYGCGVNMPWIGGLNLLL